MGFFRKLFGGDIEEDEELAKGEAPAPVPAGTAPRESPAGGDPYRDAAFASAGLDTEEVVKVGRADPIFSFRGRVLALDVNRRGPLPLRSMVYSGHDGDTFVLRRVTFGEGGYRIDWEHRTPFPRAHDGYVVRVEDRILFPLRTGMMALHVESGRPCWELPHQAALQKQPQRDRDGNLVLVFQDQSWMIVAVRDGATVREGIARNDRDVADVSNGCVAIGERHRGGTRYGGMMVDTNKGGLRAHGNAHTVDGEPVAPKQGAYPLDGEWEANDWVVLAGGKLLVHLKRTWSDKTWAAIGLLDPTSLEPLQMLELGEVRGDVNCWVIDDLVVLDTDIPDDPDDVVFIVDPVIERVVAMFREDKAAAFLFDREGARIWEKPL